MPASGSDSFARPLSVPAHVVPGVNLVGFLEGELGLGEVARKLGRGLERAGIPFAPIPYRRTPSRREHPLEHEPSGSAPYDTNIICLNADYLHPFVADVGVEFFVGRRSIGVWFWETSVFAPAGADAFRFLDEVWVASEYVRGVVASTAEVPVYVAPLPIEAPAPGPRTRADLGLPEGFMFLFLFDFVSAQRKNPRAVVDAFTKAFEPGEGPILVLKSINGRERKPQQLDELAAAAGGRSDIELVDEYYSAEDKEAVVATSDCYVSLHRSEGFGLTMAEAMAYGKPVIATGYSGNLEFMDAENSYLVPYRLVPVPDDWWAHAPGAEWAEPDVDVAAALMREVYGDRAAAAVRGEIGRENLAHAFSLDRTAAFIADRLAAIGAGDRPAAISAREPRMLILEASHELEKGVAASLLAASGHTSGLVRRLLARALWPYLAEQHRVNTATLDALTALLRSHEDLNRRLDGLACEREDSEAGGAA